jgi:hypothetical protein
MNNRPISVVLINPSNLSSSFGVMTPRWLPVLAAATPTESVSELQLIDQAVEPIEWARLKGVDLIGLSIHTLNARRAYDLMHILRRHCDAKIVLGGVHASIFPEEGLAQGADAVVKGDGELVWPTVIHDVRAGRLQRIYDGGRVAGSAFTKRPRWDLMKLNRYLVATVHTARGCPERCTFCSVWRTDGRDVRLRESVDTVEEVKWLYRQGFRFIALADDNFYAVGEKNYGDREALLRDRYELMDRLAAEVPTGVTFLTQTTIRTADDPRFLRAMARAGIRGVLIGIESFDAAGLRSIHKSFNKQGQDVIDAVNRMQDHGIYILGSTIVGLATDTPESLRSMHSAILKTRMAFAQFLGYTVFPGTVDYDLMLRDKLPVRWAAGLENYWLADRVGHNKLPYRHPNLSGEEIMAALRDLWTDFYSFRQILARVVHLKIVRPDHFVAYLLMSRLFKAVYFDSGIATDSARTSKVGWLTRRCGELALRLLKGRSRTGGYSRRLSATELHKSVLEGMALDSSAAE